MPNEFAIRLSDRPADRLVRIHTEHTDWDEPEVRYLRRKRDGAKDSIALRIHDPEGHEEIFLAIGNVNVRIHADEDHIRLSLCEMPAPPPAA